MFGFFKNLHFISAVFIPFFISWGKLQFSQVLLLQSLYLLFVFLLEVPTGAVADYLGRKVSISLGALFGTIAAIVYASYPSFYVFLLGEFIFAIGTTLISGADKALIYDSLKKMKLEKQSKKIFARWHSFKLTGLFIGPLIGSVIAVKLGLRYPMLLLSVPLAIAGIIALTLKEPKTKQKIESRRYVDVLVKGVKYFVKHKELKIIAFDFIVISIVSYYLIWTYQLLLQRAGVSIAYFGVVSSLLVLSQIVVINNYSRLEKLFGSKANFLTMSSLLLGVGLVIASLTSFVPLLIIAILISGAFGLGRRPIFDSYLNKFIPSRERATVISFISMLSSFSLIVLNPIVGKAVDLSLTKSLLFLGAFAIVFSLIFRIKEEILID